MKGALARTAWKLLRRVGTWVTGCALALSGLIKALDPSLSAKGLDALGVPAGMVGVAVLSLSFAEAGLGARLLVADVGRRSALALAVLLAGIGLMRFHNAGTIGTEACGCYGRWEVPPAVLWGIILLGVAVALLGILRPTRQARSWTVHGVPVGLGVAAALGALGAMDRDLDSLLRRLEVNTATRGAVCIFGQPAPEQWCALEVQLRVKLSEGLALATESGSLAEYAVRCAWTKHVQLVEALPVSVLAGRLDRWLDRMDTNGCWILMY